MHHEISFHDSFYHEIMSRQTSHLNHYEFIDFFLSYKTGIYHLYIIFFIWYKVSGSNGDINNKP